MLWGLLCVFIIVARSSTAAPVNDYYGHALNRTDVLTNTSASSARSQHKPRRALKSSTDVITPETSLSYVAHPADTEPLTQADSGRITNAAITNYRPQSENPDAGVVQNPFPKMTRVLVPADARITSRETENGKTNGASMSRRSIFSMIHPALAAALAPEKMDSRALPEKGPITRVEYRSAPLKGTEVRDRIALGLDPYPETAGRRPHRHQYRLVSQRTGTEIKPVHDINDSSLKRNTLPLSQVAVSGSEHHRKIDVNSARTPMPFQSSDENDRSLHRESAARKSRSSILEETRLSLATDLDKAKGLRNGLWKGVWDEIRRTAEALSVTKETTPTHLASNDRHSSEDDYAEAEAEEMVRDIIRSIQTRSEDAQAHRNTLERNQRGSAGDGSTLQYERARNEEPLPMRSSVVVNREDLVEAVTNSAKRIIFSKSPKPSPQSTLNLLQAVQLRLAEELKGPYKQNLMS